MRRGHRQGLSYMTAGSIALVVIVVVCYLGFTKAIPFQSHFEVKAVFKSSNNLGLNSPVRIAGVNVGKVVSVDHSAEGDETVTAVLRLNEKARPVHKDARVVIRPRIFLEGNFFVDLSPGTPSAPELGDGDVIPVNQTATPVQLDQVLAALQSDTREDLKSLLREYGDALDKGGAEGFNRSLPHWRDAYRGGALVSEATLGKAEHDLSEYMREAGVVAEALDRSPEQLKALISDFFVTANAFAREGQSLRAAVAELPRTLRAAQPALGELNGALPGLRGLAQDLRPGVANSEEAIDASMPLVSQLRGLVSRDELRGLVTDLRRSTPALSALSKGTVPIYEQVRLISSCTNNVLLPWADMEVPDPNFPPNAKVYQQAAYPLPGLAGESRSGDANGQWIRVLAAGGTNLIQTGPTEFAVNALPIEGTNPPKPEVRPENRTDVPCETQQTPDLRTIVGPPPKQWKVDTNDPKYIARLEKDKKIAVDWLKEQLKYEGLSDTIKVSEAFVSKDLLERRAAANERKAAGR